MSSSVYLDQSSGSGDAIGALFGAGVAQTLYFVDAAAPGSSEGTLQIGGSAPSVATMGTGWVLGTVHSSNEYSNLVYASISAATNFSTTVKPPAAPLTTNCFRTATPLTGQFLAGNWSLKLAVLMTAAGTSGNANIRVRVFRSTSATGASATELTSATVSLSNFAIATTSQQNTTATWAAPLATLKGEYLFVEIAIEVLSGAVSATGATCKLVQDGTNSLITTTAFTASALSSDHTFCCFVQQKTNTATNTTIWQLDDDLGDNSYGHELASVNGSSFGYIPPNGSSLTITGPTLVTGVWYFLALVVSGGGTKAALYWKIVGAPELQSGFAAPSASSYVPLGAWLGNINGGSGGTNVALNGVGFEGFITGARLWSGVALSAMDLENESWQTRAYRRRDLTAEWDIEQPQGGRYFDKTGHGYNLAAVVTASAPTFAAGPPLPRNWLPPRVLGAAGSSIGALAGEADAVAGASAPITGTGVIAGTIGATSTATGAITGMGVLAGDADAIGAASGAVTGTGRIAGEVDALASASGATTGTGLIAGEADAVATATAPIVAHGILAGEADATTSASGTAVPILPAAGEADAVGGASAAILATGVLAASAAAAGAASAALEGLAPAAGTAAGVGGASAGIAGEGMLTSRADAAAGAGGALVGRGEIAGESDAVGGASGLAGALAEVVGSASGIGGASATLGATVLVSGEADARAGASGAILAAGELVGAAAGQGSAGAALEGLGELAGSAAAVAGAAGQLGEVGALQGSAAATAGASGTIRGEVVIPCIEQELAAVLVPLGELPAAVAGDRLSAAVGAPLTGVAGELVPLEDLAAVVAGDRLQAPVGAPLLALSAPLVALTLLSAPVAGDRLLTEPECSP